MPRIQFVVPHKRGLPNIEGISVSEARVRLANSEDPLMQLASLGQLIRAEGLSEDAVDWACTLLASKDDEVRGTLWATLCAAFDSGMHCESDTARSGLVQAARQESCAMLTPWAIIVRGWLQDPLVKNDALQIIKDSAMKDLRSDRKDPSVLLQRALLKVAEDVLAERNGKAFMF